MKLLLDTNVLIDYYLRRQPYFGSVSKLLMARIINDVQLWSSAKSYTDISYVASRYVDPQMLQQAFLKSFELIDVCSIDSDDIKRSAELNWADFEDCLISVAAEKVKADAIVTREPKGFERASMAVLSPDQVLGMLEKERGLSYGAVGF